MAEIKARRYIFLDGKVQRIGVNRKLEMPEQTMKKFLKCGYL
jgi:hypothetical protein